jgi:hypothetical protein
MQAARRDLRRAASAPQDQTEKPPEGASGGFPSKIREKREEKWMNVYGKGCCWPFAELSAKQLPYAPRIPDFSRPVVNRL